MDNEVKTTSGHKLTSTFCNLEPHSHVLRKLPEPCCSWSGSMRNLQQNFAVSFVGGTNPERIYMYDLLQMHVTYISTETGLVSALGLRDRLLVRMQEKLPCRPRAEVSPVSMLMYVMCVMCIMSRLL